MRKWQTADFIDQNWRNGRGTVAASSSLGRILTHRGWRKWAHREWRDQALRPRIDSATRAAIAIMRNTAKTSRPSLAWRRSVRKDCPASTTVTALGFFLGRLL